MASATHSRPTLASNSDDVGAAWLPSAVGRLAPREREVATAVYRGGPMTASEVQASLSQQISNGAVRSMLSRLVRKGILGRTLDIDHHLRRFAYFGSITPKHVKHEAVRQLSMQYFDGSLLAVAQTVVDLLRQQRAA
jgi:predicted transcriptional regulator